MTRLMTASELERLTDVELRATFNRLVNDISRARNVAFAHDVMQASLENVERELHRRKNFTAR